MKKLSTPRSLTLVNKAIEYYTFESNTFHRFTIQKYDGKWEMRVEWIFREEPEYGGTFTFDTLKEAKTFATDWYRVKYHF